MEKYFGGFSELDDIKRDFKVGYRYDYDAEKEVFDDVELFPTDNEVLFAFYGRESWEGDAFVLFEKNGQLYEVHGGHCSCYGLEDQWLPEETSWIYLKKMVDEDRDPSYQMSYYPGVREAFKDLVNSK